ncbi:PepSY domain-containing protein [Ruegeria sp. EL01]|uniref:PepSY domain-containing protein n=1 Tax=Ruegeria sp. EL01 TaxID=2107578 RepID=UPI0013C53435|nr:PepSY domain-containing protein [Ruegeria sp. EL01]
MTNKISAATPFIASIISAAILVTVASEAFAESDPVEEFSLTDMLDVTISFEQATKIAIENATGQIVEIALDEFDGQTVYYASLASETSLSDLTISGEDGSILATSVQTAASPEIMDAFLEQEFEFAIEFGEMMGGFVELELLDAMFTEDGLACEPVITEE